MIVATSWHVDHGKPELIKALSGKNKANLFPQEVQDIAENLPYREFITTF